MKKEPLRCRQENVYPQWFRYSRSMPGCKKRQMDFYVAFHRPFDLLFRVRVAQMCEDYILARFKKMKLVDRVNMSYTFEVDMMSTEFHTNEFPIIRVKETRYDQMFTDPAHVKAWDKFLAH